MKSPADGRRSFRRGKGCRRDVEFPSRGCGGEKPSQGEGQQDFGGQ
ncbi:hypothetical protein GCWU000341_00121 [Oribacterium sp. oral taxon 078 str. F0262]|nr:hypothetical protein GCWU000341_00121 [Oribacterium sp. oral taxon 078 str. F0262]